MKVLSYSDHLDPAYQTSKNREDLDYFLALQEYTFPSSRQYTPDRWDKRAMLWEQERKQQRKDDNRVDGTVNFLIERGILTSQCCVADIGCGPGRFAAAFARRASMVVGFDSSPKMVELGNAYLRELGIENAQLHCRNFLTMDIQKEGCEKAFDLVFASMTPAIHNTTGLQKAMDMSRAWCVSISHIQRQNLLRDRLLKEVFSREPDRTGEGRAFYALFNILYLMGYEPETSFITREKVTRTNPDEEYAAYIMEHMLPLEEHTMENAEKIKVWLLDHTEEDGLLTEISCGVYGQILWDVRNRSNRPDYRSLLK